MKMKMRVPIIALSMLALAMTGIMAQASMLVLPDDLHIIEAEAFYGDTAIDEVVLPEGITEIGPRAFANSSLSEINLPDSLTHIDDTAFDGPDKVTVTANEGTAAFDWAVANGYMTAPVESEHPYALNSDELFTYTHPTAADYLKVSFNYDTYFEYGHSALTIIDSEGTENTYSGDDLSGVSVILPGSSFSLHLLSDEYSRMYGFKVDRIISMSEAEYQAYLAGQDAWQEFWEAYENQFHFKVKLLDDNTLEISEYTGSDTDVVIPSEIDDKPVVRIGAYAFNESALTSITIPEGVTCIGHSAFRYSGLTSITVPDGVTCIGNYAFYGCENLTGIALPEGIARIGENAFFSCTNLMVVNYGGTKEQWSAIIIGEGNGSLLDAPSFHASYGVGEYVTFGAYEQDNDESNGKEPIEWIVLAGNGRSALLLSRFILDAQRYNNEYKDVTWEACTLRTWLNGTFLDMAFTAQEQQHILLTNVDNSSSQGSSGNSGNWCDNTMDRIFLLSCNEALTYLPSRSERMAVPTDYAIAQRASRSSTYAVDGIPTGWWWLRSPGDNQYGAANVSYAGYFASRSVNEARGGVRPALWVNLDSGIF